MPSYLPRSGPDRFWSSVTAATVIALVWLIVAVGPESPSVHVGNILATPHIGEPRAAVRVSPERAATHVKASATRAAARS